MNHLQGIVRYMVGSFAALTICGCTDANPQLSALKTMETFELKSPQIVTSDLSSISVSAICSNFITDIELSFDSGTTWMQSLAYDPATNFACQTNRDFQMTLSNSKAPWNGMTITTGQTLNVKFRARARTGTYITKDLQVLFSPGLRISQEALVGSGMNQSGTNGGTTYHMRSRARFQEQSVATGSNGLTLRGRILQ
ncbi:hypothetical protein [Bdellovibrio sp. HCB2-146]|uniref:hypothetical protein n=1 Tax=Bdellovibrio sp. HCB2-146 TaxID=3394362 RepID=UPI0039BC2F97